MKFNLVFIFLFSAYSGLLLNADAAPELVTNKQNSIDESNKTVNISNKNEVTSRETKVTTQPLKSARVSPTPAANQKPVTKSLERKKHHHQHQHHLVGGHSGGQSGSHGGGHGSGHGGSSQITGHGIGNIGGHGILGGHGGGHHQLHLPQHNIPIETDGVETIAYHGPFKHLSAAVRGHKKKKKKIKQALMKLLLIGTVIKSKIELFLKIVATHLQLKFFIVALAGLLLNLARFYIDIKRGQTPQKVIYYEHAHHQHHYDEHDDGWGGSSGYWKRSLEELPESVKRVS